MAPSIAQEAPDVDALNRIAELKLTHAYDATQHGSVSNDMSTDDLILTFL
jgi:hypothetical protein